MHIFVCKLDFKWEEHWYLKALERVDKLKKQRIARFVYKEDAYRSLLADVLLRSILHDQLHLSDEDMVFGTNEYGKPYLVNRDDIFFNLTHSGDWVGCVIGQTPVGIDIELIQPIDFSIAKRFFSPEEYFSLQKQSSENRLDFFYGLWTLKESYIKAVGKGLAIPLGSFTVQTVEDPPIILTGLEQGYHCKKYDFVEGYKLAVCSKETCFPTKPKFVDSLRLMNGELITR